MAIITSLRKSTKGTFGKIIMWGMFFIMLGGYGFAGVLLRFFKSGGMQGVALINGIDVSHRYFAQEVDRQKDYFASIRRQFGNNADIYFKIMGITPHPESAALLDVVYQNLLKTFSQSITVPVSQKYVEHKLASDPVFLKNEFQHFLPPHLITPTSINIPESLAILKNSGILNAALPELQEKLTVQLALSMVQSGFFLPNFILKDLYQQKIAAKKFSFQFFALDSFVEAAKKDDIKEEKLIAFYNEQNKTHRYWSVEKRDGRAWTFDPKNYGIIVTPEEIENYYAKTKSTRYILNPVEVQVKEIIFGDVKNKGLKALEAEAQEAYQKLKNAPDSFDEVAQNFSTRKESAGKPGAFFKQGTHSSVYEKAAFKLKNDGDISEPFEMDESFVILQRVARKDPTFKLLHDVKDDIEKVLLEQRFRSEFMRQSHQLLHQDDYNQSSYETFITQHKGEPSELKGVQKDQNLLTQRLFSLKHVGMFAAVIYDGKGVLLELTEIHKAHSIPFQAIKEKVIQDYCEEKGKKELEATLKKARENALIVGKLVPQNGGSVTTTDFITLSDREVLDTYLKKGFPQEVLELDKPKNVLTSLTDQEKKGGIIIMLDALKDFDEKSFQDSKNKLLRQVYGEQIKLFESAFIASLFRTGTIKISDELSRAKEQL